MQTRRPKGGVVTSSILGNVDIRTVYQQDEEGHLIKRKW